MCVCVCVECGGVPVGGRVLSSSLSSSVPVGGNAEGGTPLLTANETAGGLRQRGNAAGGGKAFATAP